LRGYENFYVIGAYTTGPNYIHSRRPIQSLDALKGQKIRTNNQVEASVLEGMGATPTVLPVSRIADTIAKGAIDGASLAPAALVDYHIAPMTPHHYLLRSGVNPLLLLMNRKTFEGLPEAAQALIRKHSAGRAATVWIESYGRNEQRIFESIKSDARQQVVEPTAQDTQAANRIFEVIVATWASENSRNADLLKELREEVARLRSRQ
jgi:TRAP-type C4-dicarboxylate transport system substrate-binding protein